MCLRELLKITLGGDYFDTPGDLKKKEEKNKEQTNKNKNKNYNETHAKKIKQYVLVMKHSDMHVCMYVCIYVRLFVCSFVRLFVSSLTWDTQSETIQVPVLPWGPGHSGVGILIKLKCITIPTVCNGLKHLDFVVVITNSN